MTQANVCVCVFVLSVKVLNPINQKSFIIYSSFTIRYYYRQRICSKWYHGAVIFILNLMVCIETFTAKPHSAWSYKISRARQLMVIVTLFSSYDNYH